MAELVLFHHVQGLTEGVWSFVDRIRAAGHTVHLPDVFEGRTFDSIDEGMSFAREYGFEALMKRGVEAADEYGTDGLVYGGLSWGVMPAQNLAQTRPGARGAVFLHGCVPMTEFGPTWPPALPVQIHAMSDDPFFAEEGGDIDAAREIVAVAHDAELFLYPGNEHLFTDSSLPAYDEAATALVVQRVVALLDSLS